MKRLGIVTGMQFEADILAHEIAQASEPAAITVACAGPSYRSARRTADRLLDEGCEALLSFGVAGALLEGLKPGTLLLAGNVSHWGETIDVDRGWMARLRLGLGQQKFPVEAGNLAHSDPPAATPSDKRSLHIQSQAFGVDMESFAVAEAAQARSVPFLTLRVIADTSNLMLPLAALQAMNPDGTVSRSRALATLAIRPWEVGDLVKLARQTAKATQTLRHLAALGVPRLFFL
ncbi:MAG: purine and other phosphorylase-like protein, family 1 [Alphaproteobacteria bacterium]|nr:purine and other phosphorylase-like protein, family 1 [Alphaproteobacteria bacterium]